MKGGRKHTHRRKQVARARGGWVGGVKRQGQTLAARRGGPHRRAPFPAHGGGGKCVLKAKKRERLTGKALRWGRASASNVRAWSRAQQHTWRRLRRRLKRGGCVREWVGSSAVGSGQGGSKRGSAVVCV